MVDYYYCNNPDCEFVGVMIHCFGDIESERCRKCKQYLNREEDG